MMSTQTRSPAENARRLIEVIRQTPSHGRHDGRGNAIIAVEIYEEWARETCQGIEHILETVDTLPVLADGTYWVPERDDDDLYHPECRHYSHADVEWDGEQWMINLYDEAGSCYHLASECYRTEAEARAAAEAKEKA